MQYIKYLPEWNRHVALELYYEGSDYLYGALFRICFPHYYNGDQLESSNTNDSNKNMKNNLPVSRTKQKKQSKKNVVSFVFLSVPNSLDDTESRSGGSQNQVDDDDERYSRNIDDGIKCLRQLLPLSDDPNTCQIVVLSSQPIIVDRITQWITSSKRQCTVIHSLDLKSSLSSSPTTSSEKMDASTGDDNVDNTTDDENKNNDDSERNNDGNDDNESHNDDDSNAGSRKHRPSSKRNNGNHNGHRQTKDKKSRGGSDGTAQSRSGGSSTIDRIPLSDLAMASNMVRTGVIGHTDHPDFQLLVEWIAYHRQMEYVNAHDDDNNKYARQRRRRTSSVSTSDIPNSATVEPLLWCAL